MSRHEKRRQRLAGLGLLACSAALLALGGDCTAALVFAPLGLWLLFSREYLLYAACPTGRAHNRKGGNPAMIDREALASTLCQQKYKAAKILCRRCGAVGTPYFYFINIQHPVMRALWQQYKRSLHIPQPVPASDEECLRFEVGLLSEETCRRMAEEIRRQDAAERQAQHSGKEKAAAEKKQPHGVRLSYKIRIEEVIRRKGGSFFALFSEQRRPTVPILRQTGGFVRKKRQNGAGV